MRSKPSSKLRYDSPTIYATRALGECRPVQRTDGDVDTAQYQIRLAYRLFDDACATDWRGGAAHETIESDPNDGFTREDSEV